MSRHITSPCLTVETRVADMFTRDLVWFQIEKTGSHVTQDEKIEGTCLVVQIGRTESKDGS